MITILSVVVHKEKEDILFGEGSNIISLVDDGGGMFLKIEQDNDVAGEARFDFAEFDEIVEAVTLLRNQAAVT